MYVDEVGNPDLESSDNFNHRFLSLTGVIMDLDYVKETFHPELENLKTKYFNSHPDEPIIFHRKELLGCKPPFSALRDAKLRKQFDRELLKLMGNWDYTVITVCIDKKKHNETYSQWKYHPYHYCMELLLERYFFYLENISSIGDVLAESRGGKEDRKLKKSFSRLWNTGTSYIEASMIQNVLSSKQLKKSQRVIISVDYNCAIYWPIQVEMKY